MRRIVTAYLVAVVILALSVGTAWGATCAMPKCDMRSAAQADTCSSFGAAHASATLTASCDMRTEVQKRDASRPERVPEPDLTVAASAVPARVVTGDLFVPATDVPDARGAPHLISIIRI